MKSGQNGLISWFVLNPVAANLLMAFILIAGTLSAISIRKEIIPQIDLGTINLIIEYPGASPAAVNENVCVKVENVLTEIDGIKHVAAVANEGLGHLTVTVEDDYAPDELLDTIRARLDAIDTFPDEVKRPIVEKETTQNKILWIILSGSLDLRATKKLAQTIKDELLLLPDIRQVEILGLRDPEIAIEASETQLQRYHLTLEEVADAVRYNSLDLPGGIIKSSGGDIQLRTTGQARDAAALAGIPVRAAANGQRVPLDQVADIKNGFKESEWFFNYQSKPAVGFIISRVGDQNALTVARTARDYVDKRKDTLPEGVNLAVMADSSVELHDRLSLMIKNLCFGAVLVFFALILFLDIRVAFWVMVGIPVSFLGAIWVMPTSFIDSSINMVTMFGGILVIGILVDDAIVIGENIHTTVHREGPGLDTVIRGVKQVAIPSTFGALTTMAAFTPILMVPGINGKLWRGVALVAIACLFFSLVESKLILPAHLAHSRLQRSALRRRGPLTILQRWVSMSLQWLVDRLYRPSLDRLLEWRYSTLAAFIGILLVVAVAMHSGLVRMVFFPEIEGNTMEAHLTMSTNSPPERTISATHQIEAATVAVNHEIRSQTGQKEDIIQHLIAWSESQTEVAFYAELLPNEKRNISTNEIIRRWRKHTEGIAGATKLKFSGTSADAGSPIHYELYSQNSEDLQQATHLLKKQLSTYSGVYDIIDSAAQRKSELRLIPTPEASHWGINTGDLARQVRRAFYGEEVQTLQGDKDEIKIVVRYPLKERQSVYHLLNMRIRTPQGVTIPLSEVAQVVREKTPAVITRFDGRRVMHIMANVDKTHQEPGTVMADIEKNFLPTLLIQFPGLTLDVGGETREQNETLGAMGRGFVLAAFAIYALMAIPLRSYIHPLIIMSTIPFGIVGAFGGHWLMGLPFSILSLAGILALAGVVVNDSLVMVSFISQRCAVGDRRDEAVKNAGQARFRAIMLTSVTTFLGLLPMMMERSLQAQFLIPMTVSLAFGILFATIITLFLIPILFLTGADVKKCVQRLVKKQYRPDNVSVAQESADQTVRLVDRHHYIFKMNPAAEKTLKPMVPSLLSTLESDEDYMENLQQEIEKLIKIE
jgi:multidrug efflux pump subunit AcrB